MQMMTRKKWMPKTLMVLVSVVALGGWLPVHPGNTLLSTRWGGLGRFPRRSAWRWHQRGLRWRRGGRWPWRSRQGRRRDSSGRPKRVCAHRRGRRHQRGGRRRCSRRWSRRSRQGRRRGSRTALLT